MAATRRVDEEYTSIPVGFRRNGNLMADSRFGNYSCGWNLRGSWVKLQKVEQIRFLSMILIRRRCVCQNIIKKKKWSRANDSNKKKTERSGPTSLHRWIIVPWRERDDVYTDKSDHYHSCSSTILFLYFSSLTNVSFSCWNFVSFARFFRIIS